MSRREHVTHELQDIALESHLEYFRRLIERSGGEIEERDGMLAWAGPHALPFLVNCVIRTDRHVRPDAVLATASRFFGRRGRGYEILGLVGRDDDVLESAERGGLKPAEPDPLQILIGDPTGDRPDPEGLDVRMVDDGSRIADVIAVNRDAATLYGFPKNFFPAVFEQPATILSEDIRAVVAYSEGHPVATAQVFLTGTVAYIGWVAVVRSSMRAGLGTFVTRAVIGIGYDAGADIVTLSASPMGAPIYRRMGFRDVGYLRGAVADPDAQD